MFSPLRGSLRDPALSKSHNKWVRRKFDTDAFANALKADRNHRFIRAISFNDLQISLYDREIGLLLESITYEDDSVIK
jgi:hypothetical protein